MKEQTGSSENNEFADMLEESISNAYEFQPGDRVNGTVVYFSNEYIFIDISGKSEAIIDASEFRDKKGNMTIKAGDPVVAFVVSTRGDEKRLSSKIGRGFISPEILQIAYDHSLPVYGIPGKFQKGGYTVSVSSIECFCPLSQIDIKVPADRDIYLNKEYQFKIIEYKEGGRNIIVSRKALLETDRKVKVERFKNELKPGDIVKGRIITIHDFGIFVKIDDTLEALVPRSEISWARNSGLEAYTPGLEVEAIVLALDWEKEKITLSIKQNSPNPIDSLEKYREGETYNGRVVNMIKAGAFIELEPGIEGFLHVSRMSRSRRVASPGDILAAGDPVNVKVSSIDLVKKQISLELVTGEPDPWLLPAEALMETVHKGIIEISQHNGINVRLENGMIGFVPKKELLKQSGDIQSGYPSGKEISVIIIQIKKETKGLILSESGASSQIDRKEYEKYQGITTGSASATLGDQLKNKFIDIQKKMTRD